MVRVLIPLPDRDFDVTEVSVPWKLLREAGHEVTFATAAGARPAADPLLITGVVFGKLGASREALAFYRELEQDPAFQSPASWSSIEPEVFDGLILPGGHAPGMRQYLDDKVLARTISCFWATKRPVGAICHGVLAVARAVDPGTGASLLHGRKTTCLPKYMERSAYWLTCWLRGRYYRTYEQYVEDEVRAALASPDDFVRGPTTRTLRGSREDDGPAFVVEDGSYLSARWPGDAYLFAKRFIARLEGISGNPR